MSARALYYQWHFIPRGTSTPLESKAHSPKVSRVIPEEIQFK